MNRYRVGQTVPPQLVGKVHHEASGTYDRSPGISWGWHMSIDTLGDLGSKGSVP